ncbi:MAG TPA: CoA transferase [Crenalkalicoccus sp.]|jgi:succinyl-CoA:(S)-malate CoA-transferase subunit B|nr:CoA transferase [Crenalkalicoccus sp.]
MQPDTTLQDGAAPGPLAGIRVLDLATFIAAPYAATLMAEFGADVVKVELPGSGDPTRRFGSMTSCGDSLPWLSEARNKRSIALDLRTAEGAATLKRLVAVADVVCENFQPGTLESWGLGWDVLRGVNPRLVMLRVSGYGQTGPYSGRPGFGRIANAFGGISFLAGDPEGPPVTPGSATLADYMSGLYGVIGVLMALRARDAAGAPGQVVDIGLYESVFRILDELAPAYDLFGKVRQRMGAATVNVVPHSHYPTGDGHWIAIACTSDKIFARLCAAMERPELAGPDRFATIAQREAARAEVDGIVTDWTRGMTRDAVLAACERAQVPCGPVYAIDEIFEDPHYAARGNIAHVFEPRLGRTLAVPAPVPRLTGTPGAIRWLGPSLGAQAAEILSEWLGEKRT